MRNIEKNDLVLILKLNVSRGMQRMGKVLLTFPGEDRRVRSAKVITYSDIYVRLVARFMPLGREQ